MKKDINETKAFHEWFNGQFIWVANDAKRLMYRAWCASQKKSRENLDELIEWCETPMNTKEGVREKTVDDVINYIKHG
jgi:hypothetical protein